MSLSLQDLSSKTPKQLLVFLDKAGIEIPDDCDLTKNSLISLIESQRGQRHEENVEQLVTAYKRYIEMTEKLSAVQQRMVRLYDDTKAFFFSHRNMEDLQNKRQILDAIGESLKKPYSRLLVVGEVSSGKSTFINILLRRRILPTALEKTTTNVYDLWYHSEHQGTFEFSNDGHTWYTLASNLFTSPNCEQIIKQVIQNPYITPSTVLRLSVPSSITQNGIILTDSPGMNDNQARNEIVREYAEHAVGIILVINAQQQVSETVSSMYAVLTDQIRNFVKECIEKKKMAPQKFFAILTHLDICPEEEKQLIEKVVVELQEILGPDWDKSRFCKANLAAISFRFDKGLYSEEFEILISKLIPFMQKTLHQQVIDVFYQLELCIGALRKAILQIEENLQLPLEDRKKRCAALVNMRIEFNARMQSIRNTVQNILQQKRNQPAEAIMNLFANIHTDLIADIKPFHIHAEMATNTNDFCKKVWEEVDKHFRKRLETTIIEEFSKLVSQVDAETTKEVKQLIQTVEEISQTKKDESFDLLTPGIKSAEKIDGVWSDTDFIGRAAMVTIGIVPAAYVGVQVGLAVALSATTYAALLGPVAAVLAGGGTFLLTIAGETAAVGTVISAAGFGWTPSSICEQQEKFKERILTNFLSKQNKEEIASNVVRYIESNMKDIVDHVLKRLNARFSQTEEIAKEGLEIRNLEESLRVCHGFLVSLNEVPVSLIDAAWTVLFADLMETSSVDVNWKKPINYGVLGEMYEAELREDMEKPPTPVVVKRASDAEGKRELFHGVEVLRKLHHKNIVRFFGVCEKPLPSDNNNNTITKTDFFVVMERMDGSLSDLSKQQLPVEKCLHVLLDVAEGIYFMHTAGYIHRAICMSNLLYRISPNGEYTVKIAFAKQQPENNNSEYLPFQAPELLSGKTDQSVDVYSFGMVMKHFLQNKMRPPSFVPDHWKRLMEECTREDPRRRPTAYSVLLQLKGLKDPSKTSPKRYRVLCLDGGGARGIIMARILQKIEQISDCRVGGILLELSVQVSELFDLICGTSTGGILTLALTRSGKPFTAQQCVDLYKELAARVFSSKSTFNFFFNQAKYDANELEKLLAEHLGEAEMRPDENIPKRDSDPAAFLLRNYELPKESFSFYEGEIGWKAKEGARATSAAPFYFPPLKKGNCTYRDGGVGFNNPTQIGLDEIFSLTNMRPKDSIAVIVSLGCGQEPAEKNASETSVLSLLIQQIVTSGVVHQRVSAQSQTEQFPYFRFNPPLSKITDLDVSTVEELDHLIATTDNYLNDIQVQDSIVAMMKHLQLVSLVD